MVWYDLNRSVVNCWERLRGLEVSVPYLELVVKLLVTLSLQWDWIPIDEVQ